MGEDCYYNHKVDWEALEPFDSYFHFEQDSYNQAARKGCGVQGHNRQVVELLDYSCHDYILLLDFDKALEHKEDLLNKDYYYIGSSGQHHQQEVGVEEEDDLMVNPKISFFPTNFFLQKANHFSKDYKPYDSNQQRYFSPQYIIIITVFRNIIHMSLFHNNNFQCPNKYNCRRRRHTQ